MAAPPPSTKWKPKGGPTKGERLSTNKTAAIQADRERTAAQSKPGEDYKKEQAAKKAAGKTWGGGAAKAELKAIKKQKAKDRLAKMTRMTSEAREKRKARSTMPTMGGR